MIFISYLRFLYPSQYTSIHVLHECITIGYIYCWCVLSRCNSWNKINNINTQLIFYSTMYLFRMSICVMCMYNPDDDYGTINVL